MQQVKREALGAALILFFVLNICFAPCLWGNKTLLESARDAPSILPQGAWAVHKVHANSPKGLDPGAPGWLSEPWFALIGQQYLRERTVPLWNPYEGYGRPLAANMQSEVFYPPAALLSLHITPRTYNWYILFRIFIAGLFSYLYLRLFISFLPAIAGGITTMLAGYYVLYITIPHLSVETLLPACLFVGELLLRRRTYGCFFGFSVVIALTVLGGMPESCLLLLTFLYLYLLFRLISERDIRQHIWQLVSCMAGASVAGVALAAFLLLPFLKLVSLSYDSHHVSTAGWVWGLVYDRFGVSVITYLFPLLLGTPQSASGWSGIRNYVGLVALFLVITAAAALFCRTRNRRLDSISAFFLFFTVVIVLKRYGFPGVNRIGNLPFYNFVNFPKYDEAILSICVSLLCAIAVERILRREVSIRSEALAIGVSFLTIPVALICCWPALTASKTAEQPAFAIFSLALPAGLLIFIGAGILVWGRKHARRLAVCIVCALASETCLNYVLPTYYSLSRPARQSSNPYAGAPFIRVLQQRAGSYRVFGRDVLHPNWASAFDLSDVRDLDAFYSKKYLPFIKTFLAPGQSFPVGKDLGDRFDGTGPYDFSTGLQRRLLQLSSAKFIATTLPYPTRNRIVDEILEQNRGHLLPGRENLIGKRSFELDRIDRECLGEHPPYQRLPYAVHIGENQSVFHFVYGIDPAVFDRGGDGVGFTIEVKDAEGGISKLFSNYIDPKHDVSERRWMQGEVNLTRYRGQSVELLFSTDPGPRGDTSFDWAAWSGFHFDDQSQDDQPFQLIYDGEARVYEYADVLPRAAIYYNAMIAKDDASALNDLTNPALDIFKTVVVDASSLDAAQRQALSSLDPSQLVPVQPARITSYRPRIVRIEANVTRGAILVLNDSDFPEWAVQIDGHPGKWFTANYMFRGVVLGPGKHTVVFTYKPKGFYIGLGIAAVTLICLILAGALRRYFIDEQRQFEEWESSPHVSLPA